jgi:RAQPRD family integrative conjugative element protein
MLKNLFLILLLSGFPFCGYAAELHPAMETDRENVALARMSVLLNHLTPLIEEAKRYQNPQARVQFRYDELQSDINKIKSGIEAKFHPPSVESRVIPPIQGDYLIFKRQSK